jgi:lysophospholipase L1-like esterase
VRQLSRARLLVGPGNTRDQVAVRFGAQQTMVTLSDTASLNEAVLRANPAQQLRLSFNCRAPRSVYGVSFESAQGITLDNFSFRGSSGLSLRRISPRQLAAFEEQQRYDLLILHYGVNVANARLANYHNYTKALGRIIDRLQAACPHTSILLIGMSDKGYRSQGDIVTDPSVPRLLAAQQQLAIQKHIAFWNLFEAMGGENTMARWVEASPSLANRDYIHLNARGARKVADLLYQFLMQHYQAFATSPLSPLAGFEKGPHRKQVATY